MIRRIAVSARIRKRSESLTVPWSVHATYVDSQQLPFILVKPACCVSGTSFLYRWMVEFMCPRVKWHIWYAVGTSGMGGWGRQMWIFSNWNSGGVPFTAGPALHHVAIILQHHKKKVPTALAKRNVLHDHENKFSLLSRNSTFCHLKAPRFSNVSPPH